MREQKHKSYIDVECFTCKRYSIPTVVLFVPYISCFSTSAIRGLEIRTRVGSVGWNSGNSSNIDSER